METKSSHVLVGAVVLALTVALFAFVLWLSRFDTTDRRYYDIFFPSVSGLAVGGAVNLSGVPVGQIEQIALLPNNPEFVRVRISVAEGVPILQGTTASIQGVGFTGVSAIQLEGAVKGAPPITEPGPYGAPVIPTKPGALGQLLNSAPQVLERVSALLARANELLNEDNQRSFSATLANIARITEAVADRAPEWRASLLAAQEALDKAGAAADRIAALADNTNRLVDEQGRPLAADLRETVQHANQAMATLDELTRSAKPGVETLTTRTLPELGALISELRTLSNSLSSVAQRLDEDPAGAFVGGRNLPDYEPQAQQ